MRVRSFSRVCTHYLCRNVDEQDRVRHLDRKVEDLEFQLQKAEAEHQVRLEASEARATEQETRANDLARQLDEERASYDVDLERRVNEEVAAWVENRRRELAARRAGGGPPPQN